MPYVLSSRLVAPLVVALAAAAQPIAAGAEPLSLPQAQRLALQRSRQLNAFDASVASSRDMAHAAGQLPDPVLKLGLDNVPADGGDRFNLTRDGMTMRRIGVMQEVTGSEKRSLRRERFEREAEKSLAEKEATTATIQRDTALAWIDRFYLEAMLATTEDFLRASASEVESADSGYRAGRGAQADVFAARTALALAQDRRADIERRLRAARIELARWTGGETAQPLAPLPDMKEVGIAAESLETHLSAHPEIIALDRQAELAATDARLASAARTPDWTWEAAFQQRGPAYSNMFSIGVSLPLPWDQANRQDREVASKLAMVEEARAKRDEMLRSHVAEVGAMLDEWRVGRERQARYRQEILPFSRERTSASLAAYAGGKSSLNDVLAARRAEFDLRLQSLQLDLDVARAWARINFLRPDESLYAMRSASPAQEGKAP
ncbi:MAG: TolC family protein [Usitatibacter sp.]